MAKTTDFLSNTSGKLNDQFYTRQTDNGTIMAHMPRKRNIVRRSEKQATLRCQMANMAAMFRLFSSEKLYNAFENKSSGTNDYNAFIQVNYNKTTVFIPKNVSQNGGCVLANYMYSRGSLVPIRLILDASNHLGTNLALGSLVIDANTTVADFSAAVLANNKDWQEGDQLTFFYAEQWVDSEGVPRATIESHRMVMTRTDQTKLWSIVSALGFTSVNGYLGMNTVLSDAGASWIHSRNKADGSTQVSTQRMAVVSSILDNYQGDAAMLASAASYGGINTKDVFLNPMCTLAYLGNASAGATQAGQTGGNGSSSGGTTGGQTGGSAETPSLTTPTISGSTPFEESTTVTITGPDGSEIRYTTDGSVPTAGSTLYSEPITLTNTTVVKAIAIKDGVTSQTTSRTFTKGTMGGDGEE